MTYHVVVQPRAERDIQLAAHWILGQSGSPATAVRWARKLRATIATLKANPERCPIDPDSDGLRRRDPGAAPWQAAWRVPRAVRHPTRHGPRADGASLGATEPRRRAWPRTNRVRAGSPLTDRGRRSTSSPVFQHKLQQNL